LYDQKDDSDPKSVVLKVVQTCCELTVRFEDGWKLG
jgi:hypothetical protein